MRLWNKVSLNLFAGLLLLISCKESVRRASYDEPVNTILTGKVNHHKPGSSITLAVNRVGFGQDAFESKLDSTGVFKFEFPTYIPTDAWVVYNSNFLLVFEPGDSIYVEFDGAKEERPEILSSTLISGTSTDLNRQILDFQNAYYSKSFGKNREVKELAIKNMEAAEFRKFADSLKREADQFLTTYSEKESMDTKAFKWAKGLVNTQYYSDLTWYPENHRKVLVMKQSEWSVPVSYYDYFNSYKPLAESIAGAMSAWQFADQYLYRFIARRVEAEMDSLMSSGLTSARLDIKDSLFISVIEKNCSDSLFRQILVAQYFNDKLRGSEIESYEKNREKILSIVTAPFLKDRLRNEYEVIRQSIDSNSTLNVVNEKPFELETRGGVFKEIAEKFSGKPLYIDIWATWCGPCIAEFPYAKKLKAELPDVAFIYVCIDSEERVYQNSVKRYQMGGVHYFLDEEESKSLRALLNLNFHGIPYYLLANKEGLVLFEGWQLRPSADATRIEMQKLLGVVNQ